ncbi:ATP-dependent nuclease [Alkalihalobacterium elongatum]|uniref:ATP-dependent nuclease n=1 Tax=Alkalihalobacterium elongatum TaxID=2675466 RepID=UPI001C1F4F47|nr:ATP-binding protein [Alkalihalobacterium elongatum]
MIIKQIKLKGWRSFDSEDGVIIDNLKRINLFIGPNNSGKSNLFKYLYYLKEKVLTNLTGDFFKYETYDALNDFVYEIPKRDTWADMKEDIICDILIEVEQEERWMKNEPTLHHEFNLLNLQSYHNVEGSKVSFSLMYDSKTPLLERNTKKPKIYNPKSQGYTDIRAGMPYLTDTVEYWYKFLNSMVFIDPIRHHSRETSELKESDYDGSNIVAKIIHLHNDKDKATEFREYKTLIEGWLKELLGESDLEIDVTQNEVRFFINRGTYKICAYLDQLGTGVSQLFMILSFLYLYKDESLNVFMEEPESNLHPDALVQLLEIIESKFPRHNFFISTHSSSLIDQIDEEWSVHQVYRKNNSPSVFLSCESVIHKHGLLDDLGIRASQLLQSNLIIWVEGPSDRVYIKKWIQDLNLGPYNLKEGKHYSFIMYGGSNLANYDILSLEDSIDMLHIGRYAVVVCDSDKNEQGSALKGRVKYISDKIDEINQSREQSPTLKQTSLKLWITEGREIENYIPEELLISVLSSEDFVKKYIMVKDENTGNRRKENIYIQEAKGRNFNQFDSFDQYISTLYINEEGCALTPEQQTRVANNISQDKNAIAIKICEHWDIQHYSKFDIKENIEEIIDLIYLANGLSKQQTSTNV